jgi:hypothetical protein
MDEPGENSNLIDPTQPSIRVTKSRVEFSDEISLSNVIRTEMKMGAGGSGSLPDIKMYISLNLKPTDVLTLFKKAAEKTNFRVPEISKAHATAVWRRKITLKDIVSC